MRKIKIPPAFGLSTTPVPATLPLHSYRRAGSDCLHRPSPGPPGGSFFLIPRKFFQKKPVSKKLAEASALNLASVPLFKRRHRLPLVCLVHDLKPLLSPSAPRPARRLCFLPHLLLPSRMEKQRLGLKRRKEHIFARRRSSFLAASAASAHLFAALTSGPSAFVPPALRAFASRVIPAHLFPAFGRAVSLCLRSSAALRAFASAPIPVDQRRQRLLCPLLLLLRHGQALRFASSPSLSSPSPSSPGGGGSSSFLAASAASAHLFAALKRAVCASAVAWWLPPRQCIRRQDPGTPPRNLKARIPAFSSHHAIAQGCPFLGGGSRSIKIIT